MTLGITQYLRDPRPSVFCVGRPYEDVRAALGSDGNTSDWTSSYPCTGLWPRLRDALAAHAAHGGGSHVTWDTYYLAIYLDRQRTILTIQDLRK